MISSMAAVPSTAQTGTDEFAQCPREPVEVGLVIDRSGSMTGDKIDAARNGSTRLVENLTGIDQSGLVSYSSSATLDKSLSFDHAATISAIEGLTAGGSTATGDAIDLSHDDIVDNRRSGVRDVMIVLTDGFTNTGSDPVVQAAQAKDDGIEVFAIGLGSSINESELREIASDPVEDHFYHPLTTGELIEVFEDLADRFRPDPHLGARGVAARAQLSVPANPVVEVVPTRAGPGAGLDQGRLAHADLSGAGWVTAAEAGANGTRAPGLIAARGNATVANVSLLGGQIRARALHSVAEATTVSGNTSIETTVRAADLWVGSEHFTGEIPPNTVVPIPGVGTAILHERHVDRTGEKTGAALVNAIHVVVDNAQVRGDVVVSRAYAGTSCDPPLGALLETHDNDAGTGGDAPDDAASAHHLTDPALVQGRLQAGDSADFYAVHVEPGEKVEAVMTPSSRATVAAEPLPGTPSASARLPDFDLYLREPGSFAVRESSTLVASSPDRVELNVDQPGWWVLEVRKSFGDGNYTLGTTVTPIPLLPQRDALQAGDASDACQGARPIDQGVHPGVLKGEDRSDWFAIDAEIGDDLAFALKPAEGADGADFDLFVYDGGCNQIYSSTLGKGLIPKGTPDLVGPTAAPATQTYHVEVRRINGIGDYYLTTVAQDPHPAVPPLDAEPGGDAGASQSGANPVADPSINQGAFPDGDAEDWYRFPVSAGDRIDATLTPGALSDLDLHLVRPDGTVQTSSAGGSSLPESVSHVAQDGGTWYLRIVRDAGGGDYTFSLATSPQP